MKKKLSSLLTTRVTAATKKAFTKKASKYGDPSKIHRELIMAFIDDRMIIHPPPNHPLYEDNDKNGN